MNICHTCCGPADAVKVSGYKVGNGSLRIVFSFDAAETSDEGVVICKERDCVSGA